MNVYNRQRHWLVNQRGPHSHKKWHPNTEYVCRQISGPHSQKGARHKVYWLADRQLWVDLTSAPSLIFLELQGLSIFSISLAISFLSVSNQYLFIHAICLISHRTDNSINTIGMLYSLKPPRGLKAIRVMGQQPRRLVE